MQIRALVTRVNDLTVTIGEKLAFLAPLATRIVIGLAFVETGTGKFRHFDNVVGFFAGLGIPFPAFNAGLVASMETVGGVMLILGLFTRFFAAGLSITMVVALMTADRADFLASWTAASEKSHTDIAAFVFLLFLVWLISYGAGRLSGDALLRGLLNTDPSTAGSMNPDSA
jgi:putative oxidoreductase